MDNHAQPIIEQDWTCPWCDGATIVTREGSKVVTEDDTDVVNCPLCDGSGEWPQLKPCPWCAEHREAIENMGLELHCHKCNDTGVVSTDTFR